MTMKDIEFGLDMSLSLLLLLPAVQVDKSKKLSTDWGEISKEVMAQRDIERVCKTEIDCVGERDIIIDKEYLIKGKSKSC